MRDYSRGLLFAALLVLVVPRAVGQKNPASLPARDSHDGLLVAADPWVDAATYKAKFKKKTPMDAGVVAIDVYFRNDSDKLIRIDLDSIRLVYAPPDGDRQKLLPLAAQDAADLILHPGSSKNPSVPRTRLPLPGRGPKKSRGKDWDELTASLEAAALQTDVVGPHTTEHGLLYFDMQHQYDMLRYTKLYIPDLTFVEKNQPLFYFEIDLGAPVK
ncbi:MAG TPA: hypothetical protein VF860_13970 [Candidatus Acidoferrales bacterium]